MNINLIHMSTGHTVFVSPVNKIVGLNPGSKKYQEVLIPSLEALHTCITSNVSIEEKRTLNVHLTEQ